MKLSIVIPVYNAEKYLRKCLETVSLCPSREVEFIIINDGSTDESKKICEEFCIKDSRYILLNKTNEGVSTARNEGIRQSKAEYILFLDADDYIDVSKWSIILSDAQAGAYDFVTYSYHSLYPNDIVKEETYPIDEREKSDFISAGRILLATSKLNTCWGKLFRRRILTEHNILFRKGVKTGEDTIFVMDFFLKIKSFLIKNESILFYRIHSESAMRSINIKAKLEDFKAIYAYRRQISMLWKDKNLEAQMFQQFFSVITNLLLVFTKDNILKIIKKTYINIFEDEMLKEIVNNTPYKRLSPFYKKIEYILIYKKMFGVLSVYFKAKLLFSKELNFI